MQEKQPHQRLGFHSLKCQPCSTCGPGVRLQEFRTQQSSPSLCLSFPISAVGVMTAPTTS